MCPLSLELEIAVEAVARYRACIHGFLNGTPFLGRVRAIAKVATRGQLFNFRKASLQIVVPGPKVKLPQTWRVDDQPAVRQQNHLAPRCRVPAFGIALADLDGLLDFHAIKPV